MARARQATLFLSSSEVVLTAVVSRSAGQQSIRMRFVGANSAAKIEGLDKLPGISNYYVGSDPTQWQTNIPQYARVAYRDLYPGTDAIFYGNPQELEYDFVVAPGADPGAIQLKFDGVRETRLDASGNLVLGLADGEVRLHRPVIYQEVDGHRRAVGGGYVLRGNSIRFHFGSYDPTQPLIIDPVLTYSTFLGGTLLDYPVDMAVDAAGNAYIVGLTESGNFPTANAFQPNNRLGTYDGFVTKINAAGTALVYSTFLGGPNGDWLSVVAVDASGNAWVAGQTASSNFPTLNPIQSARSGGSSDTTLSELSPTGSLLYSTFYGGSGDDNPTGLAVDASGVYVAGFTSSQNFPTQNAVQSTFGGATSSCGSYGDGYIFKLNLSGSSRIYSTYVGGSSCDIIYGLALDDAGSVYLTGQTFSSNFPTQNPLRPALGGGSGCTFNGAAVNCPDAFVTKLNTNGNAWIYSTYLGGAGSDFAFDIAVDSAGAAYVTGSAGSPDFPLANPLQPTYRSGDAFVTKIDPAGSALAYSTYLGGSSSEAGWGIAVESSGVAHVSGITFSTDFPRQNPIQSAAGGGMDVFVTTLSPSGTVVLFSSYLGGSGQDWLEKMAVDSSGNVYLTGRTNSGNFPLASPLQQSIAGNEDVFVVKLSITGAQTVLFSDGNFRGSDWDLTVFLNQPTAGTSTASEETSGGNPGSFRRVNNTVNGQGQSVFVWGFHRHLASTFDPRTRGAIDFIDYSEDARFLGVGSGDGQGTGPALRQNGKVYVAGNLVTGVPASWTRLGLSGLRAQQFVELIGGSTFLDSNSHPDFSANGSPIDFGFRRANSSAGQYSSSFGIDNWTITLKLVTVPKPAVADGGVVNHASFAPSPAPVAPGSIAAVFGTNLNDGSTMVASSLGADGKLGTALGGTSVTVNSTPAPLFYSTPSQLGIQIPFEAAGQTTATIQVTVNSQTSVPRTINLTATASGIFTLNQLGTGIAGVLHEDGSTLVTAQNPARPDEVVTFFATGFGALTPPLATGAPSTGNQTLVTPSVTVDGIPSEVQFSGATAGFVGLNHIKVRIPASTRTASDIPVVLTIDGKQSNSVTIPVGP
ncbi:MAG: SBBP repeat-containing protein [Acidobacteria bacterium]|nr:SBBP repeat-containing protein [Acidobacteriota bacterium]